MSNVSMKFTKSRVKYAILIALLLLVVVGIWFYKTLYVSTGSALQRAENFLFTRMTVAQLGEKGSMRYFYVTNRKMTQDNEILENRFGREREPELKFGFYDTKVEPSVGLGMFINPSEWFQTEEIQIKKMQALQQETFVEQLRQLVHDSPQRSLLIVIHGFRERFPSALRKTAFVGHILDINSPIVMFDWPGDQGSSLSGYSHAQSLAAESGAELAKTLELIVRDVQPDKIWLIANSMGGQVVVDAFHILYQDADFADAEIELEDVILTAPDISHEEFDNQFKREIKALTRNLTIYVSSNDRALVMSRIINRDSRRGESTLSLKMLEEAAKVSKLVEQGSDLVTLVDVTPVNRTRNFHNFSLETPEFFDDLFLRLANEKMPRSRLLYRLQTPEGTNYWVLTPGR
jgi:esterase/lipase superfamily enzyme